ncbi:hypothetical protein IFM89_004034 [Coptis chinensis]|uniref:Prolyl endopeptidase n=1 Tax=Coptis chinensis TaxID=261450 RepID=A0A835LHI9_9MAGN|nr:hypothetical protein IFM89_004034 [Coptis chinensis]
MSNKNDPDVITYLNQENVYTEVFMDDTVELQKKLVEEMKSRMPATVSTPPERWGPWLYYQYIPQGKEYPVLCRRLESGNDGWVNKLWSYAKGGYAREEVLLDWNEIAEQFGYVHIGTCRVSPDHNFLAYTLDTSGDEQFMLQIKDLRSGSTLPKSSVDRVVSLAWAKDSQTLVLCTRVESNVADVVPIFTENDPTFCVDITSTKDCKYITIYSNSRSTSEEGYLPLSFPVYIIDANNPTDGLQRVWKREHGTEFFLEHHDGIFYILTNAPLSGNVNISSKSYYLALCEVKDIQPARWKNVVLPGQDFSFQDMDIFYKHLVLFLDKRGSSMICSINLPIDGKCKHELKIDDLSSWFFPLPSNLCRVAPGSNHDFMTSVFRAVLSSPVMPDIIADYDMSKQQFSIVQQEEVVGFSNRCGSSLLSYGADGEKLLVTPTNNEQDMKLVKMDQRWKDLSGAFSCERREVVSEDGVSIPLTILYSRETKQKGQSPGILLGYGAYGECLDKSWSADRLSLLDRGWMVAFADVRGGGGGSPSWHEAGTAFHKLNSVHDFVACAKYLINEDYVHKDRLCAVGYSAGGLLVGAAINMYPHIFSAAILKVPFLDVCNTLLDPSLPLTTLDHEEFGDPQIQTEFEYIRSYSPYDNIPPGFCYPPLFVTASLQDSRQVDHPYK